MVTYFISGDLAGDFAHIMQDIREVLCQKVGSEAFRYPGKALRSRFKGIVVPDVDTANIDNFKQQVGQSPDVLLPIG